MKQSNYRRLKRRHPISKMSGNYPTENSTNRSSRFSATVRIYFGKHSADGSHEMWNANAKATGGYCELLPHSEGMKSFV